MADVGGILLRVAYDGRGFSGFAAQPDRRTIAGSSWARSAPWIPR
ncbi:MAG: hypothetical protein U0414_01370 [Polyangiaceae bacterium]